MSITTEYFDEARKAGKKEYARLVSNGQLGYLPSLEGILKNSEIVSQTYLGTAEIPLNKVVGTYTHLRSISFAKNFMPLLNETEFYSKWESLCKHHLKDGITDPIKVYEYLNWFYVIEGNKRVSVMKYFNAYSINAHITRLIPRMDETNDSIVLYYEYLRFNHKTKIYSIWLTRKGSFDELSLLLDSYKPELGRFENKYQYFEGKIYNVFRSIYLRQNGGKLPISTGDALLEYLRIHGIPMEFDEDELSKVMQAFMKELEFIDKDDHININTAPEEPSRGNMLRALTTFIKPSKKLKIAFVYSSSSAESAWTKGHELGRQYVKDVFGDQISTCYVDQVPENGDAYPFMKALAEDKNDVVFATSPLFREAAMRCALAHPDVDFFNCSEHEPYKHLSNYYGRTYEPSFLTGVVAGAMTKTDVIGYSAASPTPEVISCINAFALGAALVNPAAKINVAWTLGWDRQDMLIEADGKLLAKGADILSNRRFPIPDEISSKYGVHSMLSKMDLTTGELLHPLALPVWLWGSFYEKIIGNLLNPSFMSTVNMFSNNDKLVNFWWGMDIGILDVHLLQTHIPSQTIKLVSMMKKLIGSNDFHPFSGPVYDQQGVLRIENESIPSNEEILTMDWFAENVAIEK